MAVRKALFDAKVELEADVRPKWRPGSSLDLARFARPVTPSTPPLPDFATSETRGGSTPGVEQIHPTPPSHGRMRTGGFMEWLSHPSSGVCGGHHLTRRVPTHPFDASMTRGSGKDHGPPDAGSDAPAVRFNGPFKAQRFPVGHRTTTTRWMGHGRIVRGRGMDCHVRAPCWRDGPDSCDLQRSSPSIRITPCVVLLTRFLSRANPCILPFHRRTWVRSIPRSKAPPSYDAHGRKTKVTTPTTWIVARGGRGAPTHSGRRVLGISSPQIQPGLGFDHPGRVTKLPERVFLRSVLPTVFHTRAQRKGNPGNFVTLVG
eukprot:scaffold529_cov322-Pavlova_lutheri.AAC.9